jgi:hypothetical protein
VDLNVRAFRTVQAALVEPTASNKRSESARKGGLRGGVSRAKLISPERRIEIAKAGSRARWNRQPDASVSTALTAKPKNGRNR